jgi:hypothetical protein
MDSESRHGRLRSFALGGLVGASAALAAARRSRRPPHRQTPAGLAAFEGAPCYRETIEREQAEAARRGP